MIPLQLTLKNFLSYQEATLDFRGLHTACICGFNGAGKSSLLEAIGWVIWGQSRVASDDDIIHTGETDVRVDFTFISDRETYRVIRSRRLGQSPSLEFQIEAEKGFRTVSAKGVRATQEEIISYIKLDYDTFINSSYLRQGRADEFMLRRPTERKQILADLLKLNQYEELASQAKDNSKQIKGQIELLESSLAPIQEQLQERSAIADQQKTLETELKQLQEIQEKDRQQLQQLQALDSQRQTWKQQIVFQQTQYANLTQDCDRLAKDCAKVKADISNLDKLLSQEAEITAGYNELLQLQQEEGSLANKFQASQDAIAKLQQLKQQLNQEINKLNLQISQTQTRIETIQQQEKDLKEIISRTEEVKAALQQLNRYRQRLNELDQLQLQVSPLLQRRQTLHTEINSVQARLTARIEQLHTTENDLSKKIDQVPQLRQRILTVDAEVTELEKKKVRQEWIHEQGSEKKGLKERLEADQTNYKKQLKELQQKIELLQIPHAICPLCDRELDEQHRSHVIEKTQLQQQEIEQLAWLLQEQMSTCEQNLQQLREEYTQLNQEIAPYDTLLQQRGQLEAQLENSFDTHERLQEIIAEKEELERSLTVGNYAFELHEELKQLNAKLTQLNYDEQTHALARGEVERWRWAEIKQAKIDDALRRQESLNEQKPQLEAKITDLENAIQTLQKDSEIQQQIQKLNTEIEALGYDRAYHNDIIAKVRQASSWQLRYSELQQAKEQHPDLKNRLSDLEKALQERLIARDERKAQLNELVAETEKMTDYSGEINTLDSQIQQRRRQLDDFLAKQGSLQQRVIQLDSLESQYEKNRQQLQESRKKYRVYTELAQAFGKNGIQALMIENILPQLEAQTNQILTRLTNNQLHVQFLTQKATKSSRSKKKSTKLMDTLEILIADARGTRAYETYSGGEAFRINFSIRLALAQILAQRSGTSLQMLIIDEGFGTQDAEGCDRLVAAINAIASDFSCILAVTHMPQFKEAFQTRIEVQKTPQGSQLQLSN